VSGLELSLDQLREMPNPGRLVLAVVDDDPDVRGALQRLLRSHGHDVHVFASAEDYLSDDCRPDCAILDIQLPGISGLDLATCLRREGRGTPVVFITAHDDRATQEAIRLTCMQSLRKPFDDEVLLDAIARATNGQH
jgi:FixJ family two-component response regulator